MNEKIKSAFDEIKADEALKNKTKDYIYHQTNGYRNRSYNIAFKLAPALLAVILFINAFNMYFTPVAAISIDSDASIELQLNRFNKVIKAEGFNDAGKAIADILNINFKNYDVVLDEIISNNDEVVDITVSCNDEKKYMEVKEYLYKHHNQNQKVNCSSSSYELTQEAHEHGMSTGLYKTYLELVEKGYDEADLEDLNIHDMHEIIKENMHTDDNKQNNNGNNHNNENKHHYGNH